MTTHLRARVAQAGALLAVVAGGIAVAPAVALGSAPDVQITSLPTEVPSGSSLTMKYTVRDTNTDGGPTATAEIKVSGMTCSGVCGQIEQVDTAGKSFTAQLTAPTVAAGATESVTIQITAEINGEAKDTSQTVTVQGPDKPTTVTQISGKVKDQDGKAVSGASVAMQDSQGHTYEATSNGSGGYSFNSSDSKPIAPGNISVGALKNGYETATVQIQAAAGRSVTVALTLKEEEVAPPATPSASASATAEPEASEEPAEAPSEEAADPGAADQVTTSSDSDSDSGSTLFIILGILLVAAGIGAIVLVVLRRRNGAGDDEDDPTDLSTSLGGAVPPSTGRFNDATRVTGGRNATMVAPRTAAASIADAPTMVQQAPPVEDEFPDPYGAPIPPQGGYARAGGWDDQHDGYGNATRYGGGNAYGEPAHLGGPAPDDGYSASPYGTAQAGGYGGNQQRYDEPTGLYEPESGQDGGYGRYDQGGGHGPNPGQQYSGDQGQHPQQGGNYPAGGGYGGQEPAGHQGGYGTWGGPGGGIESGTAYGPQAAGGYGTSPAAGPGSGGAYGAPQQYGSGYQDGGPGYGGQGQGGAHGPGVGYDQGGYGNQAGYAHGGYGGPDGYDQRGGSHTEQPQPNRHDGQSSHPGQRRSPDWMDN